MTDIDAKLMKQWIRRHLVVGAPTEDKGCINYKHWMRGDLDVERNT